MNCNILADISDLNLSLYNLVSYRYRNLNLEITPIQGRIIVAIKNSKACLCQKDIEEFMTCNKSTISGILNTMEKNGLIKRVDDEVDMRKKNIVLTKKSEDMFDIMEKDNNEMYKKLIDGLTDDDMKLFDDVVSKLKNNIERCRNGKVI